MKYKNEYRLEWGLSLLNKYGSNFLEDELSHRHLTKSQILFLIHLKLQNGLRQDYLARMFQMNRSTITRVIKSLMNLGYVDKRIDDYNRKANFIFLTSDGQTVCQDVCNAMQKWVDIITNEFSDDEVENSMSIISRMASNACRAKGDEYLSNLILEHNNRATCQTS